MLKTSFLDIYLVEITEMGRFSIEFASQYLDDNELAQQKKIKAESRLLEFTYSRFLLKELISKYLEVDAYDIQFKKADYGKLFIESNSKPLFFNLSHTTDAIAIAISDVDEVGVDIEAPFLRRQSDILSISERYFTESEFSAIRSERDNPKQIMSFYQFWTAKEAILKALGTGLSNDLNTIDATKLVSGVSNPINISQQAHDILYKLDYLDQSLALISADTQVPTFILSVACLGVPKNTSITNALAFLEL